MGKIRLKVVGDEQLEQKQKEKAKARKETKKAKVSGVGLGGGQRIQSVGISEEEIAEELEQKAPAAQEVPGQEVSEGKQGKKVKKVKRAKARLRSKRYTENSSVVAKKTVYPVSAGIELLRKFKKSNFDETVELHINTREKGISGQVTLPHGTGKKLRIAIANDDLISEIEKGKIDFDVLVAEPSMMEKLAKVARILGPRGLMPNPKSGTISDKPEEAVKKFSNGVISYKTESQAPVIHMSIGKLSFKDEQLSENISAVLASIGATKIVSTTLKSTMSPAIRIQL